MGADCILLIVAALDDRPDGRTRSLRPSSWAWTCWWKCTTHDELDRALRLQTPLIGINNRNLRTLRASTADRRCRVLRRECTGRNRCVVVTRDRGIHDAGRRRAHARRRACTPVPGRRGVHARAGPRRRSLPRCIAERCRSDQGGTISLLVEPRRLRCAFAAPAVSVISGGGAGRSVTVASRSVHRGGRRAR